MIELIKSRLCNLKQSIRNKWENSIIGDVINFVRDKINPINGYVCALIYGILSLWYLPSPGVTNTVFSFTMIFVWYGIYVVFVTRNIHTLIQKINPSPLDNFQVFGMYFIFIFMSMSFIFFKVAVIKNFTDTLTISPLNVVFIAISTVFYPKTRTILIQER